MPSEPNWLSAADVIVLHAAVVAATGEPAAVRDIGLLESAVARPRQLWAYEGNDNVVELASLLMLAIARNHPFIQGNKRAGFVAGQVFLEFNGYQLAMEDSIEFADAMVQAINDPARDASFTALIGRHTVQISSATL